MMDESQIVKLAFEGVIKAAGGKLTEAAIEKAKQLWQKFRAKFAGNQMVEDAMNDAEKAQSMEKDDEDLLVSSLKHAMKNDRQFAEEIQNLARQINQEINSNSQNSNTFNSKARDNVNFFNNQGTNIEQTIDFSRGKTEKK